MPPQFASIALALLPNVVLPSIVLSDKYSFITSLNFCILGLSIGWFSGLEEAAALVRDARDEAVLRGPREGLGGARGHAAGRGPAVLAEQGRGDGDRAEAQGPREDGRGSEHLRAARLATRRRGTPRLYWTGGLTHPDPLSVGLSHRVAVGWRGAAAQGG